MEYLIIGSVALFTSLLTFFSGFGVGTLLTPAFVLFFPVDIAIGLTAIVHLLNNLFKLGLTYKNIEKWTVVKFGLPAIPFALLGAYLLTTFSDKNQLLYTHSLFGESRSVYLVQFIVGLLMLFFAIAELIPGFRDKTIKEKHLITGGAISGFFGGLTGHQGALRSMFLIKSELSKNQFIATGIAIACIVDFSRLSIYAGKLKTLDLESTYGIMITALICAFVGAYFGKKLLQKVTINFVQYVVSMLITVISALLMLGLMD